jgi:hypothetical protein
MTTRTPGAGRWHRAAAWALELAVLAVVSGATYAAGWTFVQRLALLVGIGLVWGIVDTLRERADVATRAALAWRKLERDRAREVDAAVTRYRDRVLTVPLDRDVLARELFTAAHVETHTVADTSRALLEWRQATDDDRAYWQRQADTLAARLREYL